MVQSRDNKARMDENGMLQGNHYSPTVNPGQTLIKQSEEPENIDYTGDPPFKSVQNKKKQAMAEQGHTQSLSSKLNLMESNNQIIG